VHWPQVGVRLLEQARQRLTLGEETHVTVAARLGELAAGDVWVELQLGSEDARGEFCPSTSVLLMPEGTNEHGETLYRTRLKPRESGLRSYRIRIFPCHPLITHRFETGQMLWV
jgi:starch phosphorylase